MAEEKKEEKIEKGRTLLQSGLKEIPNQSTEDKLETYRGLRAGLETRVQVLRSKYDTLVAMQGDKGKDLPILWREAEELTKGLDHCDEIITQLEATPKK